MEGFKSFGRAKNWLVSRGGISHKCPPSKQKNGSNPHLISDVMYVMDEKGEKVDHVQCKRCGAKRSIALFLNNAEEHLIKAEQAEKKETNIILAGFLYILGEIAKGSKIRRRG
jgi:hypothetical protein